MLDRGLTGQRLANVDVGALDPFYASLPGQGVGLQATPSSAMILTAKRE